MDGVRLPRFTWLAIFSGLPIAKRIHSRQKQWSKPLLRLIERQSLETVAISDVAVTCSLLSMTTDNLEHAENHMLSLGRKTALERVAAFLMEMDGRLTAAGVMTLPMNRRDVADYLGLTFETVSRALSKMRDGGVLDFKSKNQREIVILDRKRLATFDLQD
jgi:CRP/FNR family nitrogen fixation transcriptional regulator